MKRLITWNRVQVSTYNLIDPNTNNQFNEVTEGAIFHETNLQLADGRFVSLVEYPDATTQERLDELIAAYAPFHFTFIEEAEANTLLAELWDVTVANFEFTDNRPLLTFDD